jgi:uncharacterized protein DUF5343
MALSTAYLITTKNLEGFLNAIKSARAPERFSNSFLKQLDYGSSNDRLFIGLLKSLGFLDESAAPTKRYYEFLDQTQSGRVLANAIREAYEDLFAVNTQAQQMSVEEVKNKFRTLTQGQKSENVVNLMANTFNALSELADWEAPPVQAQTQSSVQPAESPIEKPPATTVNRPGIQGASEGMQLHYNIQIHLPESRDPAVFEAIFQALRTHLL